MAALSLSEHFGQAAITEARGAALLGGISEALGMSRSTRFLMKASGAGTMLYGATNAIEGIIENDAGKTLGAVSGTVAALELAGVCATTAGAATLALGITAPAAPITAAVAGLGCGIAGYMLGERVGHTIGDALTSGGHVPAEVSQEHVWEIVGSLPPLQRDPETYNFLPKDGQPYQYLMDGDLFKLSEAYYDYMASDTEFIIMQLELLDEMAEQDRLCGDIQRKINDAIDNKSANLSALHDEMSKARANLLQQDDFADRFYNKFGQDYNELKANTIEAKNAFGHAFEKYALKIGGDYNAMQHTGSKLDIDDYRAQQSAFIRNATDEAMTMYAEVRIGNLKDEYGFPDTLNDQPFAEAVMDEAVRERYLKASGYTNDAGAENAAKQVAELYGHYVMPPPEQEPAAPEPKTEMKLGA